MSSSSISSTPATLNCPLREDPSILFIAKRTPEIMIEVAENFETIANATGYIPFQLKSHSSFPTFVSVESNTTDPLVATLSPQFSYKLLPNESVTLLAWYRADLKGESQILLSFRFTELDDNTTTEESVTHNFVCAHIIVLEPFNFQTIPHFCIEKDALVFKSKITLSNILRGVSIQNVAEDSVSFDYNGCCIVQKIDAKLAIKPITIKARAPTRVRLLTEFQVDYFILNNSSFNLTLSLDALSDAFCNVGCRPQSIVLDNKESGKVTLIFLAIKLGRFELPIPSVSFQIADSTDTDFIGGFIDVFP